VNDSTTFWNTIPVNTNTEVIGGITVPKVRGIEISDPVYYQIDDSMGQDLRNRDLAIANAISSSMGGYFNQYIDPTTMSNDLVNPFNYGTANNACTADFPANTGTSPTCYFQFPIAKNLKLDQILYFKLHFCMSSSSANGVGLVWNYALVKPGDPMTGGYAGGGTETIAVPATGLVLGNWTSIVFQISAAILTASAISHGMIICSLQRDNSIGANHPGKFQLAGVSVYQPV